MSKIRLLSVLLLGLVIILGVFALGPVLANPGDKPLPDPARSQAATTLACNDDYFEENDVCSAATTLAPGAYSQLQACNADNDYYSLSLKKATPFPFKPKQQVMLDYPLVVSSSCI